MGFLLLIYAVFLPMGVTSAAGGMAHDFCYHGNQARG